MHSGIGGTSSSYPMTVAVGFDHDIIDGAPAARFTQQFREPVERSYGLSE